MTKKSLLIEAIRVDGGTQHRLAINQDHVTSLREALQEGRELPPMQVLFDGDEYWLYDGFHRYEAFIAEGVKGTQVDVERGSKRDAWLASLAANKTHGLPRTAADKRKLVQIALDDEELSGWSSRKLADHLGVSHELVNSMRPKVFTTRVDTKGRSYKPAPPKSGDVSILSIAKPDLAAEVPDVLPSAVAIRDGGGGGPCIRTGADHEWGDDEDRPGHYCCLQCGEPADELDPPARKPSSSKPLFRKAKELLGQLVRAVDELNKAIPNETRRDSLLEIIQEANDEVETWKQEE